MNSCKTILVEKHAVKYKFEKIKINQGLNNRLEMKFQVQSCYSAQIFLDKGGDRLSQLWAPIFLDFFIHTEPTTREKMSIIRIKKFGQSSKIHFKTPIYKLNLLKL